MISILDIAVVLAGYACVTIEPSRDISREEEVVEDGGRWAFVVGDVALHVGVCVHESVFQNKTLFTLQEALIIQEVVALFNYVLRSL